MRTEIQYGVRQEIAPGVVVLTYPPNRLVGKVV
jgi:hypothetical protein